MKQIDLIYRAKPRDYNLDERSQKVLDIEDLKEKLCEIRDLGLPPEPDHIDCCFENCKICVFDNWYTRVDLFKEKCSKLESAII